MALSKATKKQILALFPEDVRVTLRYAFEVKKYGLIDRHLGELTHASPVNIYKHVLNRIEAHEIADLVNTCKYNIYVHELHVKFRSETE